MKPGVGAFFDIDGTILPAPSLEWRFIAYLLTRDQIPARNVWRWLAHAMKRAMVHPRNPISGNKRYLSGLRESLVSDWERSLEARARAGAAGLGFSAAALERIDWHLAQQHRVFLVSGTLEPLAAVAKRTIRRDVGVCATRPEICDGHWTGALAGEHMSGNAKARAIRELAQRHGLALARSHAYGNTISDRPMLEAVGHPRAVNASWRLRHLALSRSWKTSVWRGASASRAGHVARAAAAAREAR